MTQNNVERAFREWRAEYHEKRMVRGRFYCKDPGLTQEDAILYTGFTAGHAAATAPLLEIVKRLMGDEGLGWYATKVEPFVELEKKRAIITLAEVKAKLKELGYE